MRSSPVVILGCGYTGTRVARRLADKGVPVIATSRKPELLEALPVSRVAFEASIAPGLDFVQENARVVYSIPTVEPDRTAEIVAALALRKPESVVYLSTTGVYGAETEVDERTLVAPRNQKEWLRVRAEQAIAGGPWRSLILRPAAIYGPGRGVHVSLRRGELKLIGDGSNYISRIHVDDLAEHVVAALDSSLTGFFPVADEEPCTAREIAQFCSELLGIALPAPVSAEQAHYTRRANRRVDGSAIRKALGLSLQYPNYRAGIHAAIRLES